MCDWELNQEDRIGKPAKVRSQIPQTAVHPEIHLIHHHADACRKQPMTEEAISESNGTAMENARARGVEVPIHRILYARPEKIVTGVMRVTKSNVAQFKAA